MEEQNSFGLSTFEAQTRLEKYGFNDVEEQKAGVIKKLLAPLYSPISLMLLGAILLSYFDGKIFDCYFIAFLYFINYFIQKWQEFKADKAIKELQEKLFFEVSTLRDGKWGFVNAKYLVPGDYIRLGLGSVIPADGIVLNSKNLSVNESVLTGESMSKEKKPEDKIFSGTFITAGNLEAEITATGRKTAFGKNVFSIEQTVEKSMLEKDILGISKFLMLISIISVIILTLDFIRKGFSIDDILTLDISLIIAGIPIALPAVMAIILSIGSSGLAKKMVIVRRLSALQDLANVNLLLTDKTGTLTQNKIKVVNVVSYEKGFSTDDILKLAYYGAFNETPDAIDMAIIQRFQETGQSLGEKQTLNFIPYDSDRKRSTAYIQNEDGTKTLISLGAPQIIETFDEFDSHEIKKKFEEDIIKAAKEGFRSLAVAIKDGNDEEKHMKIVGLIFLADPLEESSKQTIEFMGQNGINVKMVTGDNIVIAERIARELGLGGEIFSVKDTRKFYEDTEYFQKKYNNISAFAEVLPKDKYELVKAFKEKYVVASTGDGINDLPALKTANVGIAVSGAVSALKGSADIVLLGQGLSVIEDAILESRKIFVRLYNYSVYRISESFRLIITILVLGIWYGTYPLEPLQLILLAFLNDIPVISLAVDRVKISSKPSEVKAKERISSGLLFGGVGILNSILLFIIMTNVFHLSWPVIQTIFFLKLTVSGHLLIFVAHTKERWFRFLPSREVIVATLTTQLLATILAVTGFMMPAGISLLAAIFVWIWSLFWMQISELTKGMQKSI